MFPDFLPAAVGELTEAESITLAQRIQQQAILTPLSERSVTTTYVCEGQGNPPILLLHGFDSSVFEFRRLLPLLAAERETWALDLLGFGFTERRADLPVAPDAIASHLYSFWKAAIDRPVVLIGASMGGAAAIDFTYTYPHCVQQIVLIDSAGFAKGPALGKFLFPPLGFLATEFLRNASVRRRISAAAYFDPNLNSLDAQCCAALHLYMPRWNQATIAFTKSGGYPILAEKIDCIKQPSLIVWGSADQILGTEDAGKFAQTITNSKLVWIEECGHVPHLEKPERVAQEICAFIK